ncbi:MAG TPA: outer membrane beta-barrel protein [Chthoniobacterales bacterium]|nr:outer membrane beta-barrel protein [Chthoniobacterales bacterium]
MKKFALLLTVVCAFYALAYAGPEPLPYYGKEMKEVAPAPAPTCFNWSGFYVGGFGGYKFAAVNTTLELNGAWENPILAGDVNKMEGHAPDNLDTSGAEAGGLLGYNYQWNCWVFGIEADGGYLWLRNSEDSGTFDNFVHLGEPKSIQTAFRTHYLFTVAPRFGYALGRWLPYVTGGLAVGDLDFEQRLHSTVRDPQGLPYRTAGEVTDTRVGWMVGGGLQYAITDHWSVRAQYQYTDLGDVDFQAPGTPSVDFSSHNSASLKEHNASFAIIYKF